MADTFAICKRRFSDLTLPYLRGIPLSQSSMFDHKSYHNILNLYEPITFICKSMPVFFTKAKLANDFSSRPILCHCFCWIMVNGSPEK